ncbi:unnamed protein product, partial [Laminaria digitata]
QVDVPDFLAILDIAKPREGEVFVDLGSGTGKAVLASSCGFPEFSKCLGIELVQGLVEAAADHLRTANTFLSEPRPTSGSTASAQGNTENTLSTNGIAGRPETGASPVSSLGGGGRGGGRGGGGKNGKAPGSKAASNRGLSAADLEGLVADLLSRQPRPLQPPRSPKPLEGTGAEKDCDATARGEQEATAEEIASWLVRELGHRRQDSLRGYGGLQKFLVARRKIIDGGTPSRLRIAQDGFKVTAAAAAVSPPPVAWESSRGGGAAAGQRSSLSLRRRTGRCHRRGCCCRPTSTASSASTSPSPSSSLSSSGVSSPVPPDEAAVPLSTTLGAIARAPPGGGGSSGRDSRKGGSSGGANGAERRRLPEEGPLTCESLSGVEMVCGDIFKEDWSDAGVVYVASLLFDDGMMIRLSKAAERLRQGARIISLRKIPTLIEGGEIPSQSERGIPASIDGGEIPSQSEREVPAPPVLRLLHEGVFRMSWQMARVYIYVRT